MRRSEFSAWWCLALALAAWAVAMLILALSAGCSGELPAGPTPVPPPMVDRPAWATDTCFQAWWTAQPDAKWLPDEWLASPGISAAMAAEYERWAAEERGPLVATCL